MTDRPRAIIHLDLDAFYASVEILENPELAGKPVLVGGSPSGRGVVTSASYAARAFGVRSAMPTHRALALCPQAIVVHGNHKRYREYSRRVMELLREASFLMEQMSIDEAYLDVTDDIDEWDDAVEVAWDLQQRVRHDVGLSASLGVATNKLVAKVASDIDKPGGLTVVRPGEEASFLAPLPVRVLWGVGPVTASRLEEIGVTTVGALAELSEDALSLHFGSHGPSMARQARGIDRRKVVTEHVRKSVSQERTFAHDLRDPKELRKRLWSLSQSVARYLRRSELMAGTVAVKVRYSDFETLTRQMKLAIPTDDERVIYRAVQVLFRRAWERGRAVRLLGVAARNLSPPTGQLTLF